MEQKYTEEELLEMLKKVREDKSNKNVDLIFDKTNELAKLVGIKERLNKGISKETKLLTKRALNEMLRAVIITANQFDKEIGR